MLPISAGVRKIILQEPQSEVMLLWHFNGQPPGGADWYEEQFSVKVQVRKDQGGEIVP